MMNEFKKLIILTVIIVAFFIFLIPENKVYILLVLVLVPSILIYLLKIKKYSLKMFHIAFLGIIMIQWLTLAYFSIYGLIYTNKLLFYFSLGIFLLHLANFIYSYIRRDEYLKSKLYKIY